LRNCLVYIAINKISSLNSRNGNHIEMKYFFKLQR